MKHTKNILSASVFDSTYNPLTFTLKIALSGKHQLHLLSWLTTIIWSLVYRYQTPNRWYMNTIRAGIKVTRKFIKIIDREKTHLSVGSIFWFSLNKLSSSAVKYTVFIVLMSSLGTSSAIFTLDWSQLTSCLKYL